MNEPSKVSPLTNGQKTVRDAKTGQFLSGNKASPGRPKGSRHAIQENFLRDVHEAWQQHGRAAIQHTAQHDPIQFVKVVANLLPKEVNAAVETGPTFLDLLNAINKPSE